MNIEMVTKPGDVAKLMQPTSKTENNIDPNTGAPPGAPIEEILARIEADKAKPTPVPVVIEKSPLKLKYQWTGVDEKGHPVKTLLVETEAGIFCIAYCLAEDKEIKSVKVAKLPDGEVVSKQ